MELQSDERPLLSRLSPWECAQRGRLGLDLWLSVVSPLILNVPDIRIPRSGLIRTVYVATAIKSRTMSRIYLKDRFIPYKMPGLASQSPSGSLSFSLSRRGRVSSHKLIASFSISSELNKSVPSSGDCVDIAFTVTFGTKVICEDALSEKAGRALFSQVVSLTWLC